MRYDGVAGSREVLRWGTGGWMLGSGEQTYGKAAAFALTPITDVNTFIDRNGYLTDFRI